jgi:hypothetical protein
MDFDGYKKWGQIFNLEKACGSIILYVNFLKIKDLTPFFWQNITRKKSVVLLYLILSKEE